jgi:carbamoyltransferase
MSMKILGVFHSYSDPSAALLIDEDIVAYVEEERLTRIKHAPGSFPIRSVDYVLKTGGIALSDVSYIAQAWDCSKYDNGVIARHYDEINKRYPTSEADLAYQKRHLRAFRSQNQKDIITRHLSREYGPRSLPEIRFVNHHLSHACTAYFQSGMDQSLVLTLDGSGEEITTAWWLGTNGRLELLRDIKIPHSLGWVYSAFTEYLGFDAYDGEYKVMGLAAYGHFNEALHEKLDKLAWYDGAGGFETDPTILTRGKNSHSSYFADALPEFMGRAPRSKRDLVEPWHKDCAFSVQTKLEEIVMKMIHYWTARMGIRSLCISGGVGLNVKMNGNIFAAGLVDDFAPHPLCGDAGQSIGAAMALRYQLVGLTNKPLQDLYLGPEYSDREIKDILVNCGIPFTEDASIERSVARLVAQGKIVGWFQGRMEGGPRALGSRSILADPRDETSRDKVNAVIKYRELWRPFCPSMTADALETYFDKHTRAPFMIMTFEANDRAKKDIPAVVHIDGTSRPQVVDPVTNEKFFDVIQEFKKLTAIPVVLNTSFNIKGEPIVCTPHDALRTFFGTALDALAIGNCLVVKKRDQ